MIGDAELTRDLAQFYADPLGYVMYAFPWTTDETIQLVELPPEYHERFDCKSETTREGYFGPDRWACEFLDELGADIRERNFDGRHAVAPIQYVTSSGHGIGKSTLVAWLVKFILDTRPLSKGVITANTAEQLKTKTWAEVGKWHNRSLTSHWFDYNTGRGAMALVSKQVPEEWRCDAQTCREENSEAFAGLHAANSTAFYIFDEGSAVPDKIYEVREGGTTDGEPMTFDFGNPTRNTGKFYENCEGRLRHRYRVRHIDSREVALTNKKRIAQWVEDYGEDSDFVKVRVRGVFPSAGQLQFIKSDDVLAAMQRDAVVDRYAPLIIGVDVARYGEDDSVICTRVGYDCRSFPMQRYKDIDTVQLTGRVIETVRDFRQKGLECSALFVDGGGIGGGVVDQLRHLGYSPIEVQFGSRPINTKMYRYKSDEIWGRMRDGLGKLCLPSYTDPNGGELFSQLTQREFAYTLLGEKIHLETKKDMKSRLGSNSSPDLADALAVTFAEEVSPAPPLLMEGLGNSQAVVSEYDPLEQKW